jgi:N-acetylglucosaminyl-diphospho-decaprenol L-rhamnosyltransferase
LMMNEVPARELDVVVIIVSYKTADLAIRSLQSLEPQRRSSGVRLRVVVVDNASGDRPVIEDAVKRHGWAAWVTLIQAPKNGGFAYGNNMGVRHAYEAAVPDYIYLLNPDAQVLPGAIGALVRYLEANPRAGIIGSRIVNPDGSDWPIAFRFPGLLSELESGLELRVVTSMLKRWTVPMNMAGEAERVDWVCGASMMIRPEVIATIGGMDENYFLYFEETDFCRRANRAGFETWYVPESRVMHIRGQSTTVTDLTLGPRRLPLYWFESRRRFFAKTYGIGYAVLIDLAALIANCLGIVKRTVQGRRNAGVPFFVRDLLRQSVIWAKNRVLPPVTTFRPVTAHTVSQSDGTPQ